MQNRAARILTFCNYDVRSSVLLDELGWERLDYVRLRQLAVTMYKIHNNLSPSYVRRIFTNTSNVHSHNLRNSKLNYYVIPWSVLIIQKQGPASLEEVDNREFFPMVSRTIKPTASDRKGSSEDALLDCQEPGCSSKFSTSEDLQDYIHFGQHDKEVTSESLYDSLRRD